MSPAVTDAVTKAATPAMIAAAWRVFRFGRTPDPLGPGPAFAEAINAALAAADIPYVTTRLAEAEDRAAKAEARAEKAKAELGEYTAYSMHLKAQIAELTAALTEDTEAVDKYMSDASVKLFEQAAQVVDLTAKLNEARGVLRDCEWCIEDNRSDTICPICLGVNRHYPACRLAAVIAPETGKGDAP